MVLSSDFHMVSFHSYDNPRSGQDRHYYPLSVDEKSEFQIKCLGQGCEVRKRSNWGQNPDLNVRLCHGVWNLGKFGGYMVRCSVWGITHTHSQGTTYNTPRDRL